MKSQRLADSKKAIANVQTGTANKNAKALTSTIEKPNTGEGTDYENTGADLDHKYRDLRKRLEAVEKSSEKNTEYLSSLDRKLDELLKELRYKAA